MSTTAEAAYVGKHWAVEIAGSPTEFLRGPAGSTRDDAVKAWRNSGSFWSWQPARSIHVRRSTEAEDRRIAEGEA